MGKLSLRSGVFFRCYDDVGIVFNTTTQNVCTLNAVAMDILKIIREAKEITFDSLILELKKEYFIDTTVLSVDCSKFIKELQDNNIVNTDADAEANKTSQIVIEPNFSVEKEFSSFMCNHKQLFSCLIELTYRCNLECVHCYAKNCDTSYNDSIELSTTEVFALIDNLYECNVFKLTFTGGELFIRNDAYEIIEYAINKGFLVDIFSNGTLIDDNLIEKIAYLHPRSFQSSIYSHISSVHDQITGQIGSFEKTLTTLKRFAFYNVPINIKSIIMNLNQETYDGLEELAKTLGATFQPGLSISAKNDGNKTPFIYRIDDPESLKNLLRKKQQTFPAENCFNSRNINSAICGAGWSSLSIDPYGNVYPCNSFKYFLGNIKSQRIEDIWNKSFALQELRNLKIKDLPICKTCAYLDYCAFCPGMALSEVGNMLQPYSEACRFAQLEAELLESK